MWQNPVAAYSEIQVFSVLVNFKAKGKCTFNLKGQCTCQFQFFSVFKNEFSEQGSVFY